MDETRNNISECGAVQSIVTERLWFSFDIQLEIGYIPRNRHFFSSKLTGICGECIKHTIDGAVDGLHWVISGDFWLRFDALMRLIAFHSLNLINEEKIPLIFPIWVS